MPSERRLSEPSLRGRACHPDRPCLRQDCGVAVSLVDLVILAGSSTTTGIFFGSGRWTSGRVTLRTPF